MKIALILLSMFLLSGTYLARAGSDPEPTRVPHVIENVDVVFMPSTEIPNEGPTAPALLLHIRGYQPDRCEYPVIVEQTMVDGWLLINIYREIPPNVRCRGGEIPFDERVQIPAWASSYGDSVLENGAAYTHVAVEINDYIGLLDFVSDEVPTLIATERETMMVSTIEVVLSDDSAQPIGLQADGYVSYCNLPIRGQIEQGEENTLEITAYRPKPPETFNCPLPIRAITFSVFVPLPEDLPDGTYEYVVDDVTSTITLQRDE